MRGALKNTMYLRQLNSQCYRKFEVREILRIFSQVGRRNGKSTTATAIIEAQKGWLKNERR